MDERITSVDELVTAHEYSVISKDHLKFLRVSKQAAGRLVEATGQDYERASDILALILQNCPQHERNEGMLDRIKAIHGAIHKIADYIKRKPYAGLDELEEVFVLGEKNVDPTLYDIQERTPAGHVHSDTRGGNTVARNRGLLIPIKDKGDKV